MKKLPPTPLRLMVLVEPAGVTSVPLPRSCATLPVALKLPSTRSAPAPSSTPSSARLPMAPLPSTVSVRPLPTASEPLPDTGPARRSAPVPETATLPSMRLS